MIPAPQAWPAPPGDHHALVADLELPHRNRRAIRQLMAAGSVAVPALREGLRHPSAAVRAGCCVVLDHFLDETCIPFLMENLDHPDAGVRSWAIHALACDRCKEGACRPGEADVVPVAIRMAECDPSREVRAQALGMLGPAAVRRPDAQAALERARRSDPSPNCRRIAARWSPGGPLYERALKAVLLESRRTSAG